MTEWFPNALVAYTTFAGRPPDDLDKSKRIQYIFCFWLLSIGEMVTIEPIHIQGTAIKSNPGPEPVVPLLLQFLV